MSFQNHCRFNAASIGPVDFVVASAVVGGFATPAQANAQNGVVYFYFARSIDGTQWEYGSGVYNAIATSLARTTITANSSKTLAPINFLTYPIVDVFPNTPLLISPIVQNIVYRKITSSGTYVPTPGMDFCIVKAVGAGAGSGGVSVNISYALSSGGGGGGEYGESVFTAAQIGASQPVTIGIGGLAGTPGFTTGGNGGTTSLGALLTAIGGFGGQGSVFMAFAPGGLGGSGGINALSIPGEAGSYGGYNSGSANVVSGSGGASHLGFGSPGVMASGGTISGGTAGQLYGGGASGSVSQNQNSANAAGAPGAPGVMLITEYILA